MDINAVNLVIFSPTGTTRKILNTVADNFKQLPTNIIDLTTIKDIKHSTLPNDQLTIFGVPVYAGRIPPVAVERLQSVKGSDSPAIIIVTYGNRHFDDALLELHEIVTNQGFKPLAGAAFIGEHSFHDTKTPIATNRPDTHDLYLATDFATKIQAQLATFPAPTDFPALNIPGEKPFRQLKPNSSPPPDTDSSRCNLCGICTQICPTEAIKINTQILTDPTKCIYCCACIKTCPTQARYWNNPWVNNIKNWLNNNCQERKEPEFFL